jgi:hypothetical protein
MKYVLFVCTHNAGRSQMAEAFSTETRRRTSGRSRPARTLHRLSGQPWWRPWEIRGCADAILDRYDDVPIRSMVMTLAQRRARNCLRADRCDPLAV